MVSGDAQKMAAGRLRALPRRWTGAGGTGYRPVMPIVATIMNSTTGQPIQRFTFGRMPKPWVSFTLETGELVTADRVDIGKPAPGKVVVPISVWVTPKK
jgi:hypothetical protein